MGVATKVMALNACTPLHPSQSVVADTSPLVIEKLGKSQGILLFIFCGNHVIGDLAFEYLSSRTIARKLFHHSCYDALLL